MEFEFDNQKSESNKQKHGIDFIEAQALWDDENRLQVPAFHSTEPRFLVIGLINDKHCTAIVTYRNGIIRIISARRSRRDEVTHYES